MTAVELAKQLEQKRGELAALFDKHRNAEGQYDMTAKVAAECKARNDELTELGKSWEQARQVEELAAKNAQELEALRAPQATPPFPGAPERMVGFTPGRRSLGNQVVESKAFKERTSQGFVVELPEWELKTLMERVAGVVPESVRTGEVVPYPTRRPMVADVIPQTTTTQAAIKYMEQVTFTNAAAPKAEGAPAGQAAIAYQERSVPVEKIPVWIPVTEEQLEDVPQVRDLIDQDLMLMIALAEEEQLLDGDGASPSLQGFLNKVGVQVQPKGADPAPDAIRKAMTLVRVTGRATPTAVIIHPNDWQDIVLLRDVNGNYIWGHPSQVSVERLWGLTIVETDAITEDTALTGDFQLYSRIYRKRGISIEQTDSHGEYFVAGIKAIKATERLALVITRATAFCTVTGI